MTGLTITGAEARYSAHEVLRGLDLTIEEGALVVVLGPSGCGKTTLLRAIAGFQRLHSGTILLDDVLLAGPHVHLPPERRRIGIVPQEGVLFPHLDVGHNVGFGLRRRAERDRRVAEMLDLVELKGFERRRPAELSGGQQQRVALARALAPSPALILLDEPFAALDTLLRVQVRSDVRRVLLDTKTTALLVTHDRDEALSMADAVAVMDAGVIAQVAPPDIVYREPASLAVARAVGDVVVVPGSVHAGIATCALGRLAVRPGSPEGAVDVMLRPEQLVLATLGQASAPGENLTGSVQRVEFLGHEARVTVRVGALVVETRVVADRRPAVGDAVRLAVHGAAGAFAATRPAS